MFERKKNDAIAPSGAPSWMNLVERWFGHLDNKAIRRGVFLSVADLRASIEALSRSLIRAVR